MEKITATMKPAVHGAESNNGTFEKVLHQEDARYNVNIDNRSSSSCNPFPATRRQLSYAAAQDKEAADGKAIFMEKAHCRPPATPEERQRIREKYKERAQERNILIYQSALEEVMRREKTSAVRPVLFKVNCHTRFGQNVHLSGSDASLGTWSPGQALDMTWTPGDIWIRELNIPHRSAPIEYKYIIKEGPHVVWEPGVNHVLDMEKLDCIAHKETSKTMHVVEDFWGGGRSAI